MNNTVKKIALAEQHATAAGDLVMDNYLGLIGGLEVVCQVRIGTLNMTVADLSQLRQGQILSMQEKTHEPVDILLNNQLIARGDLMCCEDNFAIQLTEVCS